MRFIAPFALAFILTACASQPGEVGGFSSHYFKNPPPDRTVIAPETKPVAKAEADTPGVQHERSGWSSHYYRYQQRRQDAAPASPASAEAPKPAPEPQPASPAPEPQPASPAPEPPKQVAALEPAPPAAATNEMPASQTGFSSHYFKKPLTREEVAVKLEARVFMLVAQERRRIDPRAKPLSLDIELSEVARRHSEDMASKDYVGHTSDDGQTTATMIMDEDAKFRGVLGENIASQNFNSDDGMDLDDFAQRLVDSWLNSADHKANLAYALYERSGVGVALNSHAIYVTQLFASDLGLPEPDLAPPLGAAKLKKPGQASSQ